jgi:hypothetical protein
MDQKNLIAELYNCSAVCMECYSECQKESNKEMLEHCMKLDQECADVCELTAKFLERNSPNSHKLLQLCAEICNLCARECERHKHGHCVVCARECRKCASSCLGAVLT